MNNQKYIEKRENLLKFLHLTPAQFSKMVKVGCPSKVKGYGYNLISICQWVYKQPQFRRSGYKDECLKIVRDVLSRTRADINTLNKVLGFDSESEKSTKKEPSSDRLELEEALEATKVYIQRLKNQIDRSSLSTGLISGDDVKGANPNQFSAESCQMVVLDETDKYDTYRENKSEADLVSLAFERTKFYRNHKKVATSKPTVASGIIWELYNEGDQRVFMVPCPDCGSELKLEQKLLRFAETDDEKVIAESTFIECPHCIEPIYERSKYNMLLNSRWVSQNPKATGEHRSYHLSEFYSPITKWGELAVKFVKATHKAKTGDFGALHNYVNSSLAEPWNPTEDNNCSRENIEKLCDDRTEGLVPDEAIALTIGIDTQDECFWYSIRAWGALELESWQVLSGKLATFQDIEELLYRPFYTQSRRTITISAGLMDSGGHRTAEVYEFCRKHKIKLRPSKGSSNNLTVAYKISNIDKNPDGRPLRSSIKLVLVNTTLFKDLLSGKLTLEPDEVGAFHLHSNPGDEYFDHMMAEYRNEKGVWCCPNNKRNDLWDCEVLNYCCADVIKARLANIQQYTPSTLQSEVQPKMQETQSKENNDSDDDYNRSRWRKCIGR